jgi:hypothetical protein
MLNIEFYELQNITGNFNIYNTFWIAENVTFSHM